MAPLLEDETPKINVHAVTSDDDDNTTDNGVDDDNRENLSGTESGANKNESLLSSQQKLSGIGSIKRFGRDWLTKLIFSSSSAQHPTDSDPILVNKALVVAPMVDQSDLPFRLLCRKYGANLCVTPMIHARMFIEKECYRSKFWNLRDGMPKEDRPLIAQFCGSDPSVLLQAASQIQHQVDAIDINCGCPQTIAKRGKYGAFLLEDSTSLLNVVRVLSSNLDIPVTVKVRLLPQYQNSNSCRSSNQSALRDSLCLYRELVRAGASMITIHGRTRFQKGQETGPCDWDAIAMMVADEHIGQQIPILANGSIGNLEDVKACLRTTSADGVMSSEAVLEYPAMFLGGRPVGRVHLARQFFSISRKYPPDDGGQGSGLKCVRVHLHRILHADLQISTDLRNRLVTAKSFGDLEKVITKVEQMQQEMQPVHVVNEERASWYVRHRVKADNNSSLTKSRVAWEKTKIVKCVELDDDTARGIIDMFGDNWD